VARHYLDHASTSPLRPSARHAMLAELAEPSADPGRIHAEGMRARFALETAREQVAGLFGARGREVVFTSGATEAIAHGMLAARQHPGVIVLPAVEHSAVRFAAARRAGRVQVVGVDPEGAVDARAMIEMIDHLHRSEGPVSMVCLQLGNHEVGAVQPVAEVVDACRDLGITTLVDAAQAAGHLAVSFKNLGPDLLAVSAHKFGGPPGIGALLIRRGLRIPSLLVGGDQERARRAGLENLIAAAGFGAAAAELTDADQLAVEAATAHRQTHELRRILGAIDGVTVVGPSSPDARLPHIVCATIDGIEPQGVLLGLDQKGIAAHSGSACSSESLEPSPVLEAMGVDAHRSLRLSVGWSTVDADIDAVAHALPPVIAHLRSLGT